MAQSRFDLLPIPLDPVPLTEAGWFNPVKPRHFHGLVNNPVAGHQLEIWTRLLALNTITKAQIGSASAHRFGKDSQYPLLDR